MAEQQPSDEPSSLHALVPVDTVWKDSENGEVLKVLKVYFMGEQDKWMYKGGKLLSWEIVELVNDHWKKGMDNIEHGEFIPEIKLTKFPHEAHIRVQFDASLGSSGSHSKLGSEAQRVTSLEEPTMVLNLNDCVDDYHKKSVILHEFGHALGLGHEHQHPEYLDVMKRFIDTRASMACYHTNNPAVYTQQFGCLNYQNVRQSEYDPHSIMHYPTKIEMLKKEYRHLSTDEAVEADDSLSPKEKEMLKNFLLHINFVTNEPSENDKKILAQAYYDVYKKTPAYRKSLSSELPPASTDVTDFAKVPTPAEPALPLQMKGLMLIKWNDSQGQNKRYRLMDELTSRYPRLWKEFADLHLDSRPSLLTQGSRKLNSPRQRWVRVMQTWLKNDECGHTWDGLYLALKNSGCEEVVPDLKEAVDGASLELS